MIGFLDLPPEIRNRIYSYTESLIPRSTTDASTPMDGGNYVVYRCMIHASYLPLESVNPYFPPSLPIQPSITRTCHQIRHETLSTFYGYNAFVIKDEYWPLKDGVRRPFPKALLDWLNSIKRYVPLIPTLVLWSTIKTGELKTAQLPHELIAALTDLDYNFQPDALDGWVDRILTDDEIASGEYQ